MANAQQKTAPQGKDEAQGAPNGADRGTAKPTVVKKYANRRLYNTATSSYVTLEHLAQMVREGEDFLVVDAKSGDDLTRSVLTQIIFEQEGRGQTLLPVPFLRKLIGLYGDNMQSFVPSYLEASMEAFSKNQEAMRRSVTDAFASPQSGMKIFEETAKQNMAFFEQGLKMFGLKGGDEASADELGALRAEVERLKAELAAKG